MTVLAWATPGCFGAVTLGTDDEATDAGTARINGAYVRPVNDSGSGTELSSSEAGTADGGMDSTGSGIGSSDGGSTGSGSDSGESIVDGNETLVLYVPGDYNTYDSTWTWDESRWTDVEPPILPSIRDEPAMVSDGHEIILFGGLDFSTNLPLADTWAWASGVWTQLAPLSSPPPRYGHSLGRLGDTLVLFGGEAATGTGPSLDDTWTWDGTTWTEAHPTVIPPARAGALVATLGDRLVMFGGFDQNDTWLWNGADWSSVATPTSLPTAADASMATLGDTVVLFVPDDDGQVTSTWIFEGTTWSAQIPPNDAPPALNNAAAVSFGTQILLYGGYVDGSEDGLGGRTYGWNGSSWTDYGPSAGPAAYASGYTPVLMATLP